MWPPNLNIDALFPKTWRDTVMQGVRQPEIGLNKVVNNISVKPWLEPKSYQISTTRGFGFHLGYKELLLAAANLGGKVAKLQPLSESSRFGVSSAVITMSKIRKPSEQETIIYKIGEFGKASLFASTSSNLAILTTEKSDLYPQTINDGDIKDTINFLTSSKKTVKDWGVFSRFHHQGQDSHTESVAFVIKTK